MVYHPAVRRRGARDGHGSEHDVDIVAVDVQSEKLIRFLDSKDENTVCNLGMQIEFCGE